MIKDATSSAANWWLGLRVWREVSATSLSRWGRRRGTKVSPKFLNRRWSKEDITIRRGSTRQRSRQSLQWRWDWGRPQWGWPSCGFPRPGIWSAAPQIQGLRNAGGWAFHNLAESQSLGQEGAGPQGKHKFSQTWKVKKSYSFLIIKLRNDGRMQ